MTNTPLKFIDLFAGIGGIRLAYQNLGGKCVFSSEWDTFSKKRKKIANADTPAVACDFYNRYQEDIEIIKNLGLKIFRISFSWSRILPVGTGIVNHKGIEFYHRLIDACHEAGLEVWVTLYHWDLPEALQEKGGWKKQ